MKTRDDQSLLATMILGIYQIAKAYVHNERRKNIHGRVNKRFLGKAITINVSV